MKKLIAITGGIGSGKSFALSILKDLGYNVLSCDDFTNTAYQEKEIREFLLREFNSTDKNEIKKLAFINKEKYERLTDVVTKKVYELTIKKAKTLEGLVFLEVPLLFEGNYEKDFDAVIVIKRKLADRIKSVLIRSNLTENEVKERIDRQFDYENADLKDYFVIANDSTQQALKEKLLKIISDIKK